MRRQTEQEREYPSLRGLPVDICIFTVATERRTADNTRTDRRSLKSYPRRCLELVLIQRSGDTFNDHWALPGGFTNVETESLDQAAIRELQEETNLTAAIGGETEGWMDGIYLEQMKAYYTPWRDPRGPTPTVAYVALVNEALLAGLRAGGDAKQAQLFRVRVSDAQPLVLESEDGAITLHAADLAFDHASIIADALRFVENKVMTTTIARTLLPKEFTIAQLQQVIAAVAPSYRPTTTNFARDLLKTKTRDRMLLEVLDEAGRPKKTRQYSARPAQLYTFNRAFDARVSIYPRF
ncbi:MAG: NUDIX domain-containing protein [Alicyclobacillus sp.]|nr:NUDIX domain-containing protein [Alicyclobacillus sp.]